MAYTAKSLSGAQRRVRDLERQLRCAHSLLDLAVKERKLLARLSAGEFLNPLEAWEAQAVRDRVLGAKPNA